MLTRLADQAERWLDELEPLGRTWFARLEPPEGVFGESFGMIEPD